MSNPDDKTEIVGAEAVDNAARLISITATGSEAPEGRHLPFTMRWSVSGSAADRLFDSTRTLFAVDDDHEDDDGEDVEMESP